MSKISTEEVQEIKVSSGSYPKAVAGAIAGTVRDGKKVEIAVIGAGAVNQAMKSVIIANSFLAANGTRLAVVPGFDTSEIEGEERTLMRLTLKRF